MDPCRKGTGYLAAAMNLSPITSRGPGRVDSLDMVRGAAVALMVAYHACWDASHFGLVNLPLFSDPLWLVARALILAAFLVLAGVGLTLAHGGGLYVWRFTRRLAVIAGCAAVITVASMFAIPDSIIHFGVLHNIVGASLLGLAFLRLPGPVVLAAGVLFLAVPRFFADSLLDGPYLLWLGLATITPPSADYVPLMPWAGLVLWGMVAGRWLKRWIAAAGPVVRWRARAAAWRAVAWSGRHSLLVYMVHQPVLFGLAWVLATTGGGLSDRDEAARRAFVDSCQSACVANHPAALCRRQCTCVMARLEETGRWQRVMVGDLGLGKALDGLAESCPSGE